MTLIILQVTSATVFTYT